MTLIFLHLSGNLQAAFNAIALEGGLWRPEYPHKTEARLEKQQELLGGAYFGLEHLYEAATWAAAV